MPKTVNPFFRGKKKQKLQGFWCCQNLAEFEKISMPKSLNLFIYFILFF
jgi:hypothetical protein